MSEEFITSIKVHGKTEEVNHFYDYFVGKLMTYYNMPQDIFLALDRSEQIFFCSPNIFNIGNSFYKDHDFRMHMTLSGDRSFCSLEFENFVTRKRSFPQEWFTQSGLNLHNIIIEVVFDGDCSGSWNIKIWDNEVIESKFESIVSTLVPAPLNYYL
jgi:hypothetical protein